MAPLGVRLDPTGEEGHSWNREESAGNLDEASAGRLTSTLYLVIAVIVNGYQFFRC